jgi:hypothetical protein
MGYSVDFKQPFSRAIVKKKFLKKKKGLTISCLIIKMILSWMT